MRHSFKWKIQLDVRPEQLWQYVADTNSLNKAAGLSEWKLACITDPVRGSRQVGETRHMGWRLRGDEHAFEMHQRLGEEPPEAGPPLALKIGVHAGPWFAVNMNGTLDYFGTTVNVAARIQKESRGGDIMVTDEVSNDRETRKLIDQRAASHKHHEIEIRGLSGTRRIHRLIPV
jgi:hypothetical protein